MSGKDFYNGYCYFLKTILLMGKSRYYIQIKHMKHHTYLLQATAARTVCLPRGSLPFPQQIAPIIDTSIRICTLPRVLPFAVHNERIQYQTGYPQCRHQAESDGTKGTMVRRGERARRGEWNWHGKPSRQEGES